MKKARLKLTPVEVAYTRKYGICWEYHLDRLRKQGLTIEEASRIVEENTEKVYREMCEKQKKQKEEESSRYGWQPATAEAPF